MVFMCRLMSWLLVCSIIMCMLVGLGVGCLGRLRWWWLFIIGMIWLCRWWMLSRLCVVLGMGVMLLLCSILFIWVSGVV